MTDVIDQIITRYGLLENPELTIRQAGAKLCEAAPGRWADEDSAKTAITRRLRKQRRGVSENGGQITAMYITEQELRKKFDVKTIVIQALKSLSEKNQQGERIFYPDAEFVRQFGLQGRAGYRPVLESDMAAPYRGKAQGRVIWGHPDSIQLMKNEGILL